MEATTVLEQKSQDTVPFFKKRDAKTSAIRKRPATPRPVDSDSSGYTSIEGEGRKVKRRKKSGIVTGSSFKYRTHSLADLSPTSFAANRSDQISDTNDATKQSNWSDEQSILGTDRTRSSNSNSTDPYTVNGTYEGGSTYQPLVQTSPNASRRPAGPIKAPTNIRTTISIDFAPDVCKDYKKTGFCGFSESCKFLHAREDYKQGWELDKDWEVGSKGNKKGAVNVETGEKIESEAEDAVLENIPFACVICKKPYTKPIVTKCGHYFCETCALQRYRKNPSCAACGVGTGGVFNGAKGLRKVLEKKSKRAKKRRQKAIADGEVVSHEEDEQDSEQEGGE